MKKEHHIEKIGLGAESKRLIFNSDLTVREIAARLTAVGCGEVGKSSVATYKRQLLLIPAPSASYMPQPEQALTVATHARRRVYNDLVILADNLQRISLDVAQPAAERTRAAKQSAEIAMISLELSELLSLDESEQLH